MAFKVERPTLIVFPNGEKRVADFVFPHPGGVCFIDLWWDRPEAHPFHVLTGEIKAGGSETTWIVGDFILRPLTKDDPEWDEWQAWLDYKEHGGGAYLTDDMAIAAARESGAIIN